MMNKVFIVCVVLTASGAVEFHHNEKYTSALNNYHHDIPSIAQHEIHNHHEEHYPHHHPKYQYKYGVEDIHTGDVKSAQEHRDGDSVQGSYTLLQPDGKTRLVHYTSDKHSGFNAEVSYSGDHIEHAQPVPYQQH